MFRQTMEVQNESGTRRRHCFSMYLNTSDYCYEELRNGGCWDYGCQFLDRKGEGGRGYLMIPFYFPPSFKHRIFENCFNCRKR